MSNKPLSLTSVVGYGSGDLGVNLFYTGLNLYLLYYYTDVAGLSPALAGTIFMVSLIWDAITDPVMGVIATRTQSKFGRFRPYLLFTGPALGASFVLMFAAPIFWPEWPALACLLTHLLFRTMFTAFSVPYSALSAAMTSNSAERTSLAGSRMQFATFGAIATAFCTPSLAQYFGQGDLSHGYMMTVLLYAIVAEVVFLIAFFTTKESSELNTKPLQLTDSLQALRSNKAFWILFGIVLPSSIATTLFTKAVVYHVQYGMSTIMSVRDALTSYTIAASLSILFWTWLGRVLSKTILLKTGLLISLLTFITLYTQVIDARVLFLLAMAFAGIGMAATVVSLWAMLPDTVEFAQLKSGIRDDGIVYGLYQFALKLSSGIAVGGVGLLLSAIGYVANAEQPADTLNGIRTIAFLLPAGFIVTAIIVSFCYPLSAKRHQEILQQLSVSEKASP